MRIFKIVFLALISTTTACAQKSETKTTTKPEYSNVDYSKRSNIIKNPAKLTGDEKAIFYHPFFLKLTSKQAKELKPLEIKVEFAKLGITIKENNRFVDAYSFFRIDYWAHKVSCEQWESFKDLNPNYQD